MNRRAFVAGLGAMLAAPLGVEAQQVGKIYRLGVLSFGGSQWKDHRIYHAFRAGLMDMGYVEDKNLFIEYRWAEEQPERLDPLATT